MTLAKKVQTNRLAVFVFGAFGVLLALAFHSKPKQVTYVIQAEVVDEIQWPK
jgi:hypothetical protein